MDFCNLPQCVSQPLQYFLKANFSPEKKNERRSLFQDTRDSGIPQFIENVHVCKFRISARITSSNLNLGQMIKSACLLRLYFEKSSKSTKKYFQRTILIRRISIIVYKETRCNYFATKTADEHARISEKSLFFVRRRRRRRRGMRTLTQKSPMKIF